MITVFIVGFGLGMVVGCLSWLIAAAYLEACHQSVIRQYEEPPLRQRRMAVSGGYVAQHASK